MSLAADMPWRAMRLVFPRMLRRRAELTVEGAGRVPRRGPVIVAARHVHHAYDGAALLGTIGRPTHLVVTLDWLPPGPRRELLARLCRAARWPTVVRAGGFGGTGGGKRDPEAVRRLRAAVADSVALLAEGRVLVVFPEGYPNVDPNGSPKQGLDEMLPFKEGYLAIAARLHRETGRGVPVIPTGFAYREDPWRIRLAFGEAVTLRPGDDLSAVNAAVEAEVRRLSGLPA